MQTTNKREYRTDMIETVFAALDKLPDNPPQRAVSAREIVIASAEKIRARLDAGYTYQQIVETLKEAGFNISVGTLKTYLSVAAKAPRQKRKEKRNTASTSSNTEVSFAAKPQVQATATAPARTPAFQDPDEK